MVEWFKGLYLVMSDAESRASHMLAKCFISEPLSNYVINLRQYCTIIQQFFRS